MAYGMFRRARQNGAEDGFILLEVLVSALILAIVAGAVLALITATTHSAASERAHSVAYGLAQEDQALLRTMRLSDLNERNKTTEPTIGGTKYVVQSQGRFVNNSSGTRSCSSGDASADYVEITSTVSSSSLRTPVSLHSIVSPSNGSLDPSHGSLAIQAVNGESKPVSRVKATISGPTNGTASTGDEGCVIFADIPAGVYRLKVSADGLINRKGESEESYPTVEVPASGIQQISVNYDRAGRIAPTFVYAEPSKPELQPAAIDSMMIYNSEGGPASTYGSPGTYPPNPALEVTTAYPFDPPYSVYAGSCTKDQPKEPSIAMPSFQVEPGETATPTVQVPALQLQVLYGGNPVENATVTVTDTQCPDVGTKVKRTFFTNNAGYAASNSRANTQALGLPYSIYNICATAKLSNSYRTAKLTNLAVTNPDAPTKASVTLTGSGSTTGCP